MKLPCLINGHRPLESDDGYPCIRQDQVGMILELPCLWCNKKIRPPKGFSGSFKGIRWEEVDGSDYSEKPVDKELHIKWRYPRTGTTLTNKGGHESFTESRLDITSTVTSSPMYTTRMGSGIYPSITTSTSIGTADE